MAQNTNSEKWTGARPTKAGWYGYKIANFREVVEVFEVPALKHPIRVRFGDGRVLGIASCSGDWCGPIELPE